MLDSLRTNKYLQSTFSISLVKISDFLKLQQFYKQFRGYVHVHVQYSISVEFCF